jgi:hypothetical protein
MTSAPEVRQAPPVVPPTPEEWRDAIMSTTSGWDQDSAASCAQDGGQRSRPTDVAVADTRRPACIDPS